MYTVRRKIVFERWSDDAGLSALGIVVVIFYTLNNANLFQG